MSAIPIADAPRFGRIGRRTAMVRVALGATVVGAIVASALVARHPDRQTIVQLPEDSEAIVVLDMSASISTDTFSRIGSTLSGLAESGGRYGLVVFSDQAYEALPPGSPSTDLEPLVRYFTLPAQERPGFAPQFPANPWSRSFSAGTKISAGLSRAHEIATTSSLRRPGVILVSDLDDDPQDVRRLATVLLAFRRDRIPVQVVALNPSDANLALFRRILGGGELVLTTPPEVGGVPTERTPFPWLLVALALVAASTLAAHELWSPRLVWGGRTS